MCGTVVSPAICGTVIARYGTEEQRRHWLPGLADGTRRMAFGITEPDAGSNSHRISTVARRDGEDWLLTGRKVFISGIDHADAVLFVARTEDARTGRLRPSLFVVPRDTPGFEYRAIPMELVAAEKQFPFPYVVDETQEVARAYGAVCTPDFFGYNADLELQYRGRLDASKTTPVPGAIRELYEAMVQIAETGRGPEHQIPSMGCTIKWKQAA